MSNKLFDVYIQEMSNAQEPISSPRDKDVEIDNFNELFFETEKQKSNLRIKIVNFVKILLAIQILFFNVIIGLIIFSIIIKYDNFNILSSTTVSCLLSFLKYYISATVVELLGMLFFITQYSFSKIDSNYFSHIRQKTKKKRKKRVPQ